MSFRIRPTTYYRLPALVQALLPAPTFSSTIGGLTRLILDLREVKYAADDRRADNDARITALTQENRLLAVEAGNAWGAALSLEQIFQSGDTTLEQRLAREERLGNERSPYNEPEPRNSQCSDCTDDEGQRLDRERNNTAGAPGKEVG